MYTEPEIVSSNDLTKRAYVTFYFNGERIREYTGRSINLQIFPNRAKTVSERQLRLGILRLELLKNLMNGTYPVQKQDIPTIVREPLKELTTAEVLQMALTNKLDLKLSQRYKADLELIHKQLLTFLKEPEQTGKLSDVPVSLFDKFLGQFASSGTYYMKKRSDLTILLNTAFKLLRQPSPTKSFQRMRRKESLHQIYTKEQMRRILNYLKLKDHSLFLCCLLTYGCWLRPHIEVRMLTKRHFKNQHTEIHLSGYENKGGKVRTVHVPEFVRKELVRLLNTLQEFQNLFTLTKEPFNEDYFSTSWGRLKTDMISKQLIFPGQTMYSFRHTAAVEVFRKKKDIYLLQRLLGHSSIQVTLKYLRGLGEINLQEMIDAAPTLD